MRKILIGSFVFIFALSWADAQYQNVVIKSNSGEEQLVPLANLQKLTFSSSNLVVNYIGDTTQTKSLESINKLYFKTTTSEVHDLSNKSYEYTIYPNPSMENISIKGIENYPVECTIYNFVGEKLNTIFLKSSDESIRTNELTPGVYFIRINNQIRKFDKYEK